MKIINEEVQRKLNGGTNIIDISDSILRNVIMVQLENLINIVTNININIGNKYPTLRKSYHSWK